MPLRRLVSPEAAAQAGRSMAQTLLCFVLTDGNGGHAFCSRYDLGPWPLLADVREVDAAAASALSRCSAVFVNGFVFDELRPAAVGAAIALAKANGQGFLVAHQTLQLVQSPAGDQNFLTRTEH